MKFENAAERRNTVVTGSVDEFRLIVQALLAEKARAAIEERRVVHGGHPDVSYLGSLIAKVEPVLTEGAAADAVERTVVFDFDEMKCVPMCLANAADSVEGHAALLGVQDERTEQLAMAYRGLAQHWQGPAEAATIRVTGGQGRLQ